MSEYLRVYGDPADCRDVIAEVDRLRSVLLGIVTFADEHAQDASRSYDENLGGDATALASSISALRIIEQSAREALEGLAG
jgi:hypothetical protein